MRKLLALFVCLSLAFAPLSARAGIFGEEMGPLTAISTLMGELVRNSDTQTIQQFMEIINTAKDTLAGINNIAETARTTYGLYKTIRNYTPEQLLADLQGGLLKSFPEVKDLMEEIDVFRSNIEGIQDDRFLTMQTKWTSKNQQFYASMANGLQSSALSAIAPEAAAKHGWKASSMDQIFYGSMIESGLANELKSQTFKKAIVGTRVSQLCEEAHKKQASSDMAACLNMAMQMDSSQDIKDMAMLAKLRKADEENFKAAQIDVALEREIVYQEAKQKPGNSFVELQSQSEERRKANLERYEANKGNAEAQLKQAQERGRQRLEELKAKRAENEQRMKEQAQQREEAQRQAQEQNKQQ